MKRFAFALVLTAVGCDAEPVTDGSPDPTLVTHAVEPSTPTPAGLAYVQAIARVHEQAEGLDPAARIRVLSRGLAVPVPAGLAEAEILRLDLLATLAQAHLGEVDGARVAVALLQPELSAERSLPLDRASARALVVLGDAAVQIEDDALAAGSYIRAIRVMSLLRQELEP